MGVPDEPQWPEGDPGKVLLHAELDCSVDAVFQDFFGIKPEFQAKLHKQRGDTNCTESPWVNQRNELPLEQHTWEAPDAHPGTPGVGKLRKARFDAPPPPLGGKGFSSEEIQKVLAHCPGSHYMVESEVYTNAMYGDKFVIISRFTLVAQPAGRCTLHISYAVAFHPSMSRMIRPMVQKGVEGGIRGTYTMIKKLLAAQYSMEELPDMRPAPSITGLPALPVAAPQAVAPVSVAPAAAPAAVAVLQPPPLFGLADYLVYRELATRLASLPDPELLAKALSVLVTLVALHGAISLLQPLEAACTAVGGGGGTLCWLVRLLEFPDSVQQVLGALLLVAVVNKALLLGTQVLSAHLRESAVRRAAAAAALPAPAAVATPTTAAQGSVPSAAAAEPGAAPSAAPVSSPARVMAALEVALPSDSSPGRGATPLGVFLSKSFGATKAPLPKPPSASSLPPAPSSQSSPDLVRRAAAATDGGAQAGINATAGRAALPGAAAVAASDTPAGSGRQTPINPSTSVSPATRAASAPTSAGAQALPAGDGLTNQFATVMGSWSKNLLGSEQFDGSAEGLTKMMAGAWYRTQEHAKQLIQTVSSDGGDSAGGARTSASGAGPEGTPAAPPAAKPSGGSASSSRHRNTDSFTASIEPGFMLIEDYAQATQATGESLAGVAEEGGSPESALPTPTGRAASAAATLSVTASWLFGVSAGDDASPVAASPTEPWGEESAAEVACEVFEHERVQPFRGWGHSWPGHFLPSDRVGHWGDRAGGPGGPTSMLFERVAPRLPPGWRWAEREWRVDVSAEALAEEGVDADGWSYGVDFSWLKWPPEPGSGRYTLKMFVRRRRWVRLRVREEPGGDKASSAGVPLRSLEPSRAGAGAAGLRSIASKSAPLLGLAAGAEFLDDDGSDGEGALPRLLASETAVPGTHGVLMRPPSAPPEGHRRASAPSGGMGGRAASSDGGECSGGDGGSDGGDGSECSGGDGGECGRDGGCGDAVPAAEQDAAPESGSAQVEGGSSSLRQQVVVGEAEHQPKGQERGEEEAVARPAQHDWGGVQGAGQAAQGAGASGADSPSDLDMQGATGPDSGLDAGRGPAPAPGDDTGAAAGEGNAARQGRPVAADGIGAAAGAAPGVGAASLAAAAADSDSHVEWAEAGAGPRGSPGTARSDSSEHSNASLGAAAEAWVARWDSSGGGDKAGAGPCSPGRGRGAPATRAAAAAAHKAEAWPSQAGAGAAQPSEAAGSAPAPQGGRDSSGGSSPGSALVAPPAVGVQQPVASASGGGGAPARPSTASRAARARAALAAGGSAAALSASGQAPQPPAPGAAWPPRRSDPGRPRSAGAPSQLQPSASTHLSRLGPGGGAGSDGAASAIGLRRASSDGTSGRQPPGSQAGSVQEWDQDWAAW